MRLLCQWVTDEGEQYMKENNKERTLYIFSLIFLPYLTVSHTTQQSEENDRMQKKKKRLVLCCIVRETVKDDKFEGDYKRDEVS